MSVPPRTLGSKLHDGSFNVKTYGAKGDGATDDYAIIQVVLDANPSGKKVIFPVAPKITNSLIPGAGTTLECTRPAHDRDQPVLQDQYDQVNKPAIMIVKDNITVKHFTIEYALPDYDYKHRTGVVLNSAAGSSGSGIYCLDSLTLAGGTGGKVRVDSGWLRCEILTYTLTAAGSGYGFTDAVAAGGTGTELNSILALQDRREFIQ